MSLNLSSLDGEDDAATAGENYLGPGLSDSEVHARNNKAAQIMAHFNLIELPCCSIGIDKVKQREKVE